MSPQEREALEALIDAAQRHTEYNRMRNPQLLVAQDLKRSLAGAREAFGIQAPPPEESGDGQE